MSKREAPLPTPGRTKYGQECCAKCNEPPIALVTTSSGVVGMCLTHYVKHLAEQQKKEQL